MKIAITAQDNKLEGSVCRKFSRANGCIIYDGLTKKHYFHSIRRSRATNSGESFPGDCLLNQGVNVVITGSCNFRDLRKLTAQGIRVYTTRSGNVRESISRFLNNELEEASSAFPYTIGYPLTNNMEAITESNAFNHRDWQKKNTISELYLG